MAVENNIITENRDMLVDKMTADILGFNSKSASICVYINVSIIVILICGTTMPNNSNQNK
jgi:hypothetical protein